MTGSASDREWDAFVAGNVHGYHEQTSAYGRIRSGYGFSVDRAVVRAGGEIVGGAQVLAQRTPAGTFAHVLRAPLASEDDPRVLREVAAELDALAKRQGYVSMRVDTLPTQTAALDALNAAEYETSDTWSKEMVSLVAPLGYSDEQLLSRMIRGTRYGVRRAERNGVTVCVGDSSSIDEFLKLRERTASHQRFLNFPREYFEAMWQLFGNAGRAQLMLAHCGGQAVAAMFNVVAGCRLYFMWVGMHRGEAERKLMANHLLHFHAMRWGRDHGCTHYDLIGVSTNKKKFAQDEIRWPQPRRKFFGPLRRVRQSLMAGTWSSRVLRRGVTSAARRMGLKPRMPY